MGHLAIPLSNARQPVSSAAIFVTSLLVAIVMAMGPGKAYAWMPTQTFALNTPNAFTTDTVALPGGVVEHSSPTLADLDGDGQPEILIGTTRINGSNGQRNRNAVLAAVRGNGTLLWSRTLDAAINSSPAVGDINGDGRPEVVVSTGGDVGDRHTHSYLMALDRNGNELWRFAFVDHGPQDGYPDGAFGSPTLCDLEGDGDLEIVLGSWDQRIYVMDHNGNPVWYNLNRPPGMAPGPGYYNADSIWSTAACTDLNGDGSAEIIIGADITGGGILPDGTRTENGGFLYIFDRFGNVLVRRFLPEAIFSSPAVGDLDNDGRPEIVTGTGWYWWNQLGRNRPSYVYVFDTSQVFSGLAYSDPAKLPDAPGWPRQTEYPGFSSPALGDLDGDGDLEIVIGAGHPDLPNDDIPGAGLVYAWHHTGQPVAGWPLHPRNGLNDDSQIKSSPVLADIDGDGSLEVLFAMLWDVQVYNGNGTLQEILGGGWTVVSSPAVGDTDGDNRTDIWIGSSHYNDPSRGYLWHYENSQPGMGDMPWPMFHGDAANLGVLNWPRQQARPMLNRDQVFEMADTNPPTSRVVTSIRLNNQGTVPLQWSADLMGGSTMDPASISFTPRSGQVAPGATTTIRIQVDVGGLSRGTHRLGNILIQVSDSNGPLDDSPYQVPITVLVDDIRYNYLPAIVR
ncbi:MAG: hypothetical protein KatS3mg050_4930 [Litorilinea sp.]|nr:MAG: hypothetical protein KatS3mg050_4930 [Litorilinea sp.]